MMCRLSCFVLVVLCFIAERLSTSDAFINQALLSQTKKTHYDSQILLDVSSLNGINTKNNGFARRNNLGNDTLLKRQILQLQRRHSQIKMSNQDENDLEEDKKLQKEDKDDPNKGGVVPIIFDVVYKAWSALVITLGIYFSCGIVLNICGYGYRVEDFHLRIEPLQQFRAENQFNMEIQRSMNEASRGGIKIDNLVDEGSVMSK